MMKNTEWGACSYLAESKYGRNGTEIEMNSTNYTTGQGNYVTYANQSTTGNVYGIYDMNGTSWEGVAGVLDSKLSNGSNYNFTEINSKYYNAYASYNESKKIKGDGVYETSRTGSNSTSWHQDYSFFVGSSYPSVRAWSVFTAMARVQVASLSAPAQEVLSATTVSV